MFQLLDFNINDLNVWLSLKKKDKRKKNGDSGAWCMYDWD